MFAYAKKKKIIKLKYSWKRIVIVVCTNYMYIVTCYTRIYSVVFKVALEIQSR